MYFAARHKDVKLAQDYADFVDSESKSALILCDGIGEFEQSGKAAKIVVECFIQNVIKEDFTINDFVATAQREIKCTEIIGGTTMVCAIQSDDWTLNLHYLGNGGIIHLYGDFGSNPFSELPYRYIELMNPHVTPDGALIKHISHNSGESELAVSTVNLNLNSGKGDILLFFTDGIASLEEKAIMKTEDGVYWRHENETIQIILNLLQDYLKKEATHFTVDVLIEFIDNVLNSLKQENKLEDDASLGIIITDEVIKWYKSDRDAQRIN